MLDENYGQQELKFTETKTYKKGRIVVSFENERISIEKMAGTFFGDQRIILTKEDIETVFRIVRAEKIMREFNQK